jgi:hypothetical protein
MDQLLTPGETARLLGVSINTLACWRANERYPLSFVRIGSRVRYRLSELDRFIVARTQEIPSSAA